MWLLVYIICICYRYVTKTVRTLSQQSFGKLKHTFIKYHSDIKKSWLRHNRRSWLQIFLDLFEHLDFATLKIVYWGIRKPKVCLQGVIFQAV